MTDIIVEIETGQETDTTETKVETDTMTEVEDMTGMTEEVIGTEVILKKDRSQGTEILTGNTEIAHTREIDVTITITDMTVTIEDMTAEKGPEIAEIGHMKEDMGIEIDHMIEGDQGMIRKKRMFISKIQKV